MGDIADLIGKPLTEFQIVQMTEVYRTNEDGGYTKSEGCFMSKVMALAYASKVSDSFYMGTRSVLVLTDGREAYFLGEAAEVADEVAARDTVLKQALSKLTAAEIQVLGLSNS